MKNGDNQTDMGAEMPEHHSTPHEEIDLIDMFKTLWQGKWTICISAVFLAFLAFRSLPLPSLFTIAHIFVERKVSSAS